MQTDHARIDIEVLGVNDPVVIGTCNHIIQYIAKVSLETQTRFGLAEPQRGLAEALPEECGPSQGWNCTFEPLGCAKVGTLNTEANQQPARADQNGGCEDSRNISYVCTNEDEYTTQLQLFIYDPDKHSINSKQHSYFVTVQVGSGTVHVAARNVTILAEGSNASAVADIYNSTSQNKSGIGRMDSRPQDDDPWDVIINQTSSNALLSSKKLGAEAVGAVVKFFGTLENVQNALRSMKYRPDQDFEGTDTLQASVHDLDCCSSGASALRSDDGSESESYDGRRRRAAPYRSATLRGNEESESPVLFADGSVSLQIYVLPVDDPVQVCHSLGEREYYPY
jgi:hypothetical protein